MKSAIVSNQSGAPGLYVDGERRVPVLFGLSDIPGSAANSHYAWRNISNFAAQGIHLVTIDVELRNGWHKHSPFEWEAMQAEIAYAMEADPQTGLLLRLHVNPPYWWLRDHPEEWACYRDHELIDDGEQLRLIHGDHLYHVRESLASQRWQQEAGENLRTFCEKVWNTEEGAAVLGIQIALGVNGECAHYGIDRSKHIIRRFRRMLREKYGTDAALQQAWGRSDVTIETAHFVPETDQRGDDGIFRDPTRSQDIIDSQTAMHYIIPEAVLHFSRIVKESWKRPLLLGCFLGNYLDTGGKDKAVSGKMMPQLMHENRDCVDFLCAPFPYKKNRLAQNVPMQRALLESHRLRGMLWLTEMDQPPAGTDDFIGGDPDQLDETIAQLRRNVLQCLLYGQGMWYYDHRQVPGLTAKVNGRNPYAVSIFRKAGWWDKPVLMEEIGRLQRLAETYTLGEYRPAADVLLVYNPDSHFYTSQLIDDEYAVHEAFARAGVVFDCIYLRELEIADMDRYRVVVFTNSCILSEAQREDIRRLTKGKQVVWLYGAGYCDGKTLSLAHMREVTGMKIVRAEPAGAYRTLASGTEYALEPHHYSPVFAVEDEQAQTLAVYPQTGAAAAARKGDSWYFGVPRLDPETAAQIVRAAGAHVYCDAGDVMLAGNGLVAINSYTGGQRTLKLRNGKTIVCKLPPKTTAVFDAETAERLM